MAEPFIDLLWAQHQIVNSPKYFWDNDKRPSEPAVCVIQLTRSGCAFYENDKGRVSVPQGYAMIYLHGENSCYGYSELESEPYVLEYIGISGSIIVPLIQHLQATVGPIIAMPDGSAAERRFTSLFKTFENRKGTDRYLISSQIYDFIMHCFYMTPGVRSPDEAIWQAREYILNNWHRPFSQEELARSVGLSREHVNRRFRELYKIAPGQFTTNIRIERARLLLKISQTPIESVALQCGYTNLTSFGRAFWAYNHISPREYRDLEQQL